MFVSMLICGYYPDRAAAKGDPIDTFFMPLDDLGVLSGVEDIINAIKDKYYLDLPGSFSRRFDIWDCFWSCDTRYIAHICECGKPCDECEDRGGSDHFCEDCEMES
jgi:hypothetical protein